MIFFSSIRTQIMTNITLRRITSPSYKYSPNDNRIVDNSPNRATNRPRRIILIRHGESQGNVDESTYAFTPDWRVALTDNGRAQAYEAGKELRNIIGSEGQVFFYYSPYRRTRETVTELLKHFDVDRVLSSREEPRISEQQFGNFQNVDQVWEAKKERQKFGRFYYRFRSGEAGLDVYSRVSSFISTLVRDCQQYTTAGYDLDNVSVVIVTHGISLRLFLMRWFQFSVEEFERSENPKNGKLVVMEKWCFGWYRWYQLDVDDQMSLNLPQSCCVPKNVDLYNLINVSHVTK